MDGKFADISIEDKILASIQIPKSEVAVTIPRPRAFGLHVLTMASAMASAFKAEAEIEAKSLTLKSSRGLSYTLEADVKRSRPRP